MSNYIYIMRTKVFPPLTVIFQVWNFVFVFDVAGEIQRIKSGFVISLFKELKPNLDLEIRWYINTLHSWLWMGKNQTTYFIKYVVVSLNTNLKGSIFQKHTCYWGFAIYLLLWELSCRVMLLFHFAFEDIKVKKLVMFS